MNDVKCILWDIWADKHNKQQQKSQNWLHDNGIFPAIIACLGLVMKSNAESL